MEDKILQFISYNGLIMAGDRVLIGVSGGADLLALLYFLRSCRQLLNIEIAAAHLNHGLRGKAADEDQALVEELCEQWDVPLFIRRVDVRLLAKQKKISVEEAGRDARYAFFKELQSSGAYNKLALGHHLNDQAETVLMRLIRGTGIKGAAGMLPESKESTDIIRPLLCVTKQAVITYCEENKLPYCTDLTNFEADATRNKFRLEILPALREINPKVEEHLADFAAIANEYESFLKSSIEQLLPEMISKKNNRVYLNIALWREQVPLIQKELLRQMLFHLKGSLKEIEYNHILSVQRLLLSEKTVWEVHLPQHLSAVRRYGDFWIEEITAPALPFSGCYELLPDKVYYFASEHLWLQLSLISGETIKKSKELKNHSEKYFDYGKIRGKLHLRSRQPGDFFSPVGLNGKKKIKDYFIDRKVTREQRDCIPLLASGSEILWILGYAINRDYQVSQETETILRVRYQFLGEKI